MAVLPEGFALPPAPYLVALVAGLVVVGGLLRRHRPPVTDLTVLAFAPWMVLGSALHVLYVLGTLPAVVRPFAGTPAVYLSVAVVAGAAWLLTARVSASTPRLLAAAGCLALVPPAVTVVGVGLERGSLRLLPSLGILVGTAVAAAATWGALRRAVPAATVTGAPGVLAVVAHALDGVSTAVGVDLLGFGERTPLSAVILEFAASLPTASLVGSGWLFVLVKLAVAAAVVAALAETVREAPTQGRLLLGFVAAVGLGPGVHNVLLFAVA
ncbi:Uncharacterized membrane protein [Haloplanus vescus]|uniref:Uncharacterized membrane protein n=1 Tax=Haloplanus vescus TaxID=555874 RepID=A0A1H4AJS7_9EURY|nr:DUF63 family protein [Haloplanus vescus]SEA36028.1 Uncharacterized membrane protein [Haloplanus vescus]